MRVTHVITRLIVGGAQENTITTVLGLNLMEGGSTNLISGPTFGSEGSLESSIGGIGLLEIERHLVRPVHPVHDCLAFQKLTRRFQKTRPDIVHTHSGKAGVIGRLAAKKAGVPIIVHTIHGPSFGPFQGAVSNLIFKAAERKAGKVTSHFISVADAMTEQYLAAGIGKKKQYSTIRSGFDLDPFVNSEIDKDLRNRLGIRDTDFVIGKIARLFKLKGHEELIAVAGDVIKASPNTKFLFVGDGPLREQFEQRLTVQGLRPHFVFTGLVPPEEVCRYVGIMNCLAHLSFREGLPRALPQAMAAGKPVVAYDCDGAREVCIEGHTGFLVEPGDRVRLTDALIELSSSRELRGRFGQNGRSLACEQFDRQKMVRGIYALYKKLMEARSR